MSFFANSSGIIIYGGNFTAGGTQVLGKRKDRDSCESDDYAQDDDLRKRRRCRSLDDLTIVKANEVNLHRELIRGIGYRIHSASHHGRLVAVKTFEGPRAKQDWTIDVAFSKEFLHSNVLQVEGVSDEKSKSHFVLFRGITSEQKMQSLIAKALRTDLNMSVQISMKAVKGIAAGLSYIKSQNIPMYPGTMNNVQNWENFNIFTGYDDEPIISFHPSSTVLENGSVSQTFDDEKDGRGVELLSGVCQQLFSKANSILYDDSPEREFDVYHREGSQRAPLEDTESTSNVSENEDSDLSNPSNSTEKPKSSRTPRREVRWLDLGVKNLSLESIKRRFEDYLDRFLSSSSNSPLRHITSPMDSRLRHNLHQCPGYLREEITLVSDVSKSVIVSHAFPSQSEVCSICGQLVQYKFTEPSIVDVEIRESLDDQAQIRKHTANGSGKRTFNNGYTPLLEKYFEHNAFPSASDRLVLARKTLMSLRQIEVWFQNHRNRAKKEGTTLNKGLFHPLLSTHLINSSPLPTGATVGPAPNATGLSQYEALRESLKSVPDSLIIMTPTSPLLNSFDPFQLTSAPQQTNISSVAAKPPVTRRKVTATGIRKGVTPKTLVDEFAPTQLRDYVTPSATSREEVPASLTRKRARSTAFDEEDQLDDYVLPPKPTERDLIEQKGLQIIPKRKEHLQLLETSREQWRKQILMLPDVFSGLNVSVPDFTTEDS